uniref:UMP-CMP kinase n=2 Tax=Nilaparvata lugens TaxID=108931 RepID=A0A1I9WLH1_NILLU|nr:seminal fluid protein [Nilaparvata lugens]
MADYQHQLPKVVFVLGGPGAGKGTQCANIVKEFDFLHLSAGDLLREERKKPDSKYGQLIEDCIKRSKIVPVEITLNLIRIAMAQSGKDKFLIDGFPRNKDNLDGWNLIMGKDVNLLFVLFFNCSTETCIERCMKRGAEGSGRADDTSDVIQKRIQTYLNESLPIVQHYENSGLVRKIDASRSADEVFEDVKQLFQSIKDEQEIHPSSN